MYFKSFVLVSLLALNAVLAEDITIDKEELVKLIKDAIPLCSCSSYKLHDDGEEFCKEIVYYRDFTDSHKTDISNTCSGLKNLKDKFIRVPLSEISSKGTATPTITAPKSDGEPKSTATPSTITTPKSDGEPKSTATPSTITTPNSDGEPKSTATTSTITTPNSDGEPKSTATPSTITTPNSDGEPKSTATPSTITTPNSDGEPKSTATPSTITTPKSDGESKSTATPSTKTTTVTQETPAANAANGAPESKRYTLANVLIVMAVAFVLGVLLAVVAKMAYSRYRKRSYVVPPEQSLPMHNSR